MSVLEAGKAPLVSCSAPNVASRLPSGLQELDVSVDHIGRLAPEKWMLRDRWAPLIAPGVLVLAEIDLPRVAPKYPLRVCDCNYKT